MGQQTLATHPSRSNLNQTTGYMKNLKRVLAGAFGALIFAIVVPIAYYFVFDNLPLDGFQGVALLVGVGAVLGAVLGVLFPRVFGFVFESFFDI
jgi:hypothetical protein